MLAKRVLFCLLLLPALALAEPLRLAVSVSPIAWLVQQVGGDRVRVQTLVRPGQDPHGFEPTPTQLGELQQATAYLTLNLPFERAWLPRVRAVNPQLQVVALQSGHALDLHDPHIWLNPQRMHDLAGELAVLLSTLAPQERDRFAANAAAVAGRLATLDSELAARFAAARGQTFLVHHAAWGHFAHRYGLTQLAIEQDGKEPGPRRLAKLTARVRALGIDTLFIEPQASRHTAQGLADALHLALIPLDPMAGDYMVNLRRSAAAIAQALR